MESWFAVFTSAQKESLASRELRRAGFTTFWPHITEWVGTGHKAKSRLVRRSWLSRYLFTRCSVDMVGVVNSTPGVSTVVFAPGGSPYPIPDAVMEELMQRLGPTGKVFSHMPKNKFAGCIGRGVKGLEGWPIWGLAGEISRVCGDEVAVKMLMFGSEREIVVPAESGELSEAG